MDANIHQKNVCNLVGYKANVSSNKPPTWGGVYPTPSFRAWRALGSSWRSLGGYLGLKKGSRLDFNGFWVDFE
eukprot:11816648-Karenia_brevis.AAC.1